jgi:hypothetical protein
MNFIKKYYLNKIVGNFVQKRTEGRGNVHALKDARSVCFFVGGEDADRVEELIQCVSTSYKEKEIAVICCVSNKKRFNINNMPPFLYAVSEKDVGITGGIHEDIHKIFSKKYDIFIDLDTKTNLISLCLKTLVKADFRIGGSQNQYEYFDFILCADEQRSIKDYLFNVELYTSKLKGY